MTSHNSNNIELGSGHNTTTTEISENHNNIMLRSMKLYMYKVFCHERKP